MKDIRDRAPTTNEALDDLKKDLGNKIPEKILAYSEQSKKALVRYEELYNLFLGPNNPYTSSSAMVEEAKQEALAFPENKEEIEAIPTYRDLEHFMAVCQMNPWIDRERTLRKFIEEAQKFPFNEELIGKAEEMIKNQTWWLR